MTNYLFKTGKNNERSGNKSGINWPEINTRQRQKETTLQTKYQSLEDAMAILGDVQNISKLFVEFQKYLYNIKIA